SIADPVPHTHPTLSLHDALPISEERAEILDDELELTVETVDGPRDLPVGMTDDDSSLGLAAARDAECAAQVQQGKRRAVPDDDGDRKSTRLNSSHGSI